MKLLWIGEYGDSELMDRLKNYGYKPMSITIAQKNFIEGIKHYCTIDTISGCRLPYAKTLNTLFFKGKDWVERDGSKHSFVNLLNIKYIELLYKSYGIRKKIKEWALHNKKDKCIVIVYGLHSPYLTCLLMIKKYIKDLCVVCIVPDLPEFYDFKMTYFKKALKKLDLLVIDYNRKFIDQYVLFAESMANYLNINPSNYVVIEGSINTNLPSALYEFKKEEYVEPVPGNKNILLYSGSVSYGYGLEILLEAFSCIKDPNYELWIFGSGNAIELIKKSMILDNRIKYYGHIAERSHLYSYFKKATMMMNMIPPENIATKYCFPSKIFEYLASGKPTLTFKLEGIKPEYYKFLHIFEDSSAQSVTKKIIEVASLPEEYRLSRGTEARDFVISKKNNISQAKIMMDFICSKNIT